jgi:hypothetical protein
MEHTRPIINTPKIQDKNAEECGQGQLPRSTSLTVDYVYFLRLYNEQHDGVTNGGHCQFGALQKNTLLVMFEVDSMPQRAHT